MRTFRELGANLQNGRLNLSVWAPLLEKLTYHSIKGREEEMQKDGEYFSLFLEDCRDGDLYLFKNGDKLLPDPLSRFQPEGVNGPSMLVDLSGYKWSANAWKPHTMKDLIIYEMHIGTFTQDGTYSSAEAKLPYLKELGINAIEIMPLSQAYGSRNWGYDGVFPFAPSYSYGKPEDLAHFIDQCHHLGISCILDIVYNHLGPIGNVFPKYAPYFSHKYSTPWGEAVNLDGPYCAGVREMFLANISYWIEQYRFDGFRMDSTQNIYDSSPRHFLSELTDYVHAISKKLNRKILMIAESDKNDSSIIMPEKRCGLGFDAVWNDDLHHSFHSYVTGERSGYYADYGSLQDIAYNIRNGFLYDGRYSEYLKAVRGTKFTGIPSSLIVALQNHDQIGNRALGERISSLVTFEQLKLGASIFLLSPFTPMLFMGEEYGETTPFWFFMQSDDKKFAEIVNKGRRNEFKDFNWPDRIKDPSSAAAFMESKLTWSDTARNRFILKLYRDLIDARKSFITKTVKRNYDVSVDNDTIRIFYPLTGLVITHNFGSSRIEVPGKIHLNTSSPDYGGSNSEPNVIGEPGSVLSS